MSYQMNFYKMTTKYYVTGVLKPESVAQLQRLGIVKVICNQPDSDSPYDELSEQMRIGVTEAGMDIASMKDRLERIYHSERHY